MVSELTQNADAFRPQRYGGIVLCGGRSRRMGCDKTWLRFGAETMLQRVVRLLAEAVHDLVVVAGVNQQLPPLDGAVRVLRDRHPDLGPLEGIAVGLAALCGAQSGDEFLGTAPIQSATSLQPHDIAHAADRTGRLKMVFVVGCDMPLLQPALVRRMFQWASDSDLLVPVIDGCYQPLTAIYAVDVLPKIEELISSGQRRPLELFPLVRTQVVGEDWLRQVDPHLRSFFNVNSPTDYRTALRWAGFDAEAGQDGEVGGRR